MTGQKRSLAPPASPASASKRRKPSTTPRRPDLDLTADRDDDDDHHHPSVASRPRSDTNRWIAPWNTFAQGIEAFRTFLWSAQRSGVSPAPPPRRANGHHSAAPGPSTPPTSANDLLAVRRELNHLKQLHHQLRTNYTWSKMSAKAEGGPTPAKPQSILDLEARMAALKLRLKKADNGSGSAEGVDASTAAGYQRKRPMGSDKHKLAIAQRDAHTLADLRTLSSAQSQSHSSRVPSSPQYSLPSRAEEDDTDAPEAEDDLERVAYAELLEKSLSQQQAKHDATSRTAPSSRRPAAPFEYGRSSSSIAGLSALDRASVFPAPSPYATTRRASTSTAPSTAAIPPGRLPRRARSDVDRVLATARKSLAEPFREEGVGAFDQLDRIAKALEAAEEDAKALELVKVKKRKFPKELPPADAARVKAILKDSGYETNIPGAAASNKDLRRLQGLTWLNDELVNFVGVLINRRSDEADKTGERGEGAHRLRKAFVFNTNFFTWYGDSGFAKVKRWTRRFDTFEKDIIIIPINHHNSHWCCAAVNLKHKRFEYYDSFGKPMPFVYERLRNWLTEEHRNRKKSEIDLSDWVDYWHEDVPQQKNVSDCGVFTCMFMETLSREVDFFDFEQKHMPYLRNKMVLQIDKHDLLDMEPWV